jgi:hypothetical protein
MTTTTAPAASIASTRSPEPLQWTPLSALRSQFEANLAALRSRDADLAERIVAAAPLEPYYLATQHDRVLLARQVGTQLVGIPNPVPPVAAQQVMEKLFPGGACTEPVNVAGIDQGWIWDALYRMECKSGLPMHRPALYFLAHDLAQLWTTLHFQDWTTLLADARVTIFAGARAVYDYRKNFVDNPRQPLPRLSLTVEPALWQQNPTDSNLAGADAVYQSVLRAWESQLTSISQKLAAHYPHGIAAGEIDRRIKAGEKLRILGITSRYTTFLQYSMRDWLAGFEALGHQTRLHIERHDAETTSNVVYLSAVADFKPDIIVIIDHYRAEYRGLPDAVPVVMWVQDYLPNILDASAGAAQGSRDFCLGFGRHYLAREYGFPADRYLAAPIGINDARFDAIATTPVELTHYACDVSYVGHASATAESLLAQHTENAEPAVRMFLHDMFDQLRAHYESGGGVVGRPAMMRMMDATLTRRGLTLVKAGFDQACALFTHSIGNALFRHQSLHWLADLGVDLHLYGKGWDQHPRFKKFAKGVADNNTQLAHIYRASRINLQVTPHGVVHPRLLDGLAAGGFFLLRYTEGDAVGKQHLELFRYCQAYGIETESQLAKAANRDAQLATLLRQIDVYEGYADHPREYGVMSVNRTHADSDFFVAAGSVWPEYDQVTYDSKAQLEQRLRYFLDRPELRRRVAEAMRKPVIERVSYKAISQRLLTMMGDRLAANVPARFQPLRLSA